MYLSLFISVVVTDGINPIICDLKLESGPLCQSMDDIVLYMQQLTKYTKILTHLDWSDEYIKSRKGVQGMKIAVSKNLDGIVDYIDDDVWSSTKEVAMYLKSMGANVEFVEPPLSKTKLNFFECVGKLWYIDMYKYGKYVQGFDNGKDMVDPGLWECCERGKYITDINELIEITKTRDEIKQIMKEFHEEYDILLTPTCAIPPPNAVSWIDDGKMKNMNTGEIMNVWDCFHSTMMFTSLFNITGQPALSMPCAYISSMDGDIPLGVQIVGGSDKDNLVLRTGYCLENKFKCLPAKL